MAESRTNYVNIMRERISHYEVDASAVAAAILERLVAGRLLPDKSSKD